MDQWIHSSSHSCCRKTLKNGSVLESRTLTMWKGTCSFRWPSWPSCTYLFQIWVIIDHVGTLCRFVSAQGVDWEALLAKRVKPPFLPSIKSPGDVSNFDEEFTRLKPVLTPPHTPFTLTPEQQEIFADFDFSSLHWLPETFEGRAERDILRLCPNPAWALSVLSLSLPMQLNQVKLIHCHKAVCFSANWLHWCALATSECLLMKESSSCGVSVLAAVLPLNWKRTCHHCELPFFFFFFLPCPPMHL